MKNNLKTSLISSVSHPEDTENQEIKQNSDEQFGEDSKMDVSYFASVKSAGITLSLNSVLEMIKDGKFNKAIENLRRAKDERDDEGAVKIKNKLPAFTPSGEFNKTHRKEDLIRYNQLIILDVDKVGSDSVKGMKKKATGINTTLAAFLSPSGYGMKILVRIDSSVESHEQAFNQVAAHYERILGVQVDKSGKDFSRLCFLSWDPEIYINDSAETFIISREVIAPTFSSTSITTDNELYQCVVSYTDKLIQYYPGNRNNHVYLLANNFNRTGINQEKAEKFISSIYTDLDRKEISSTVMSAYKHEDQYGMLKPEYIQTASSARSATAANPQLGENTPLIPERVHKNLPELLKKGCDAFPIDREKDIFLTGAITILSGCFNNVYGLYAGRKYFPSTFCFIIGPSASGKGVLKYARLLPSKIESTIINEYKRRRENDEDVKGLPFIHFIPADSSSAAVKRILRYNNETGTIFETEADTLSDTFQQDWGGYSVLSRNSFEHEPVSYARVGKQPNEVIVEWINCPKVSIGLSGTHSQVPSLFKSTDDGLFSRFNYYVYRNTGIPFFKDVFAKTGVTTLQEYFEKLSETTLSYYNKFSIAGNIEFRLKSIHEQEFIKFFDNLVKKVHFKHGEDTHGVVFRLGLITFRFAMIFTILRYAKRRKIPSKIICNDVDFENSMQLADTYIDHALAIYQALPESQKRNPNAIAFYEFLPKQFSYTQAKMIGTVICEISEKSVSNYLNELKEMKLLIQSGKNGQYFKADLQ